VKRVRFTQLPALGAGLKRLVEGESSILKLPEVSCLFNRKLVGIQKIKTIFDANKSKRIMKRLIFILFICYGMLSLSCSRMEQGDEIRKGDTDYPEWLSATIKEIETLHAGDVSLIKIQIFECEWQGRTVYYISNNLSSCQFCEVYYDNGEKVEWSGQDLSADNFRSTSKNWKLIYEFGSDLYGDCLQQLDTAGLGLYPFVPFTDEEMKTVAYRTKLERRQIPEAWLQKMQTKAVFYQFVLCELSRSMYVHNSAQAGFEAVTKELNMLPELLGRPDAGHVLTGLLQKIELSELSGLGCFHLYECIQRTLAQPEIIAHMTEDDISLYIYLAMSHQATIKDLSQTNPLQWSYPESLAAPFYGLGNVMLRFEYEPFRYLIKTNPQVNGFMAGGNLKDELTVILIHNCLTDFNK
jgi:hypothetical protein